MQFGIYKLKTKTQEIHIEIMTCIEIRIRKTGEDKSNSKTIFLPLEIGDNLLKIFSYHFGEQQKDEKSKKNYVNIKNMTKKNFKIYLEYVLSSKHCGKSKCWKCKLLKIIGR